MAQIKKDYQYGFNDGNLAVNSLGKGHSEQIVREISRLKKEPKWMCDLRVKAYHQFLKMPMPNFGPQLDEIDFSKICYYVKPTNVIAKHWNDVPWKIRQTFDRLGLSEKEQKWLGGVATQYDSEMVYAAAIEKLRKIGIIFESTDVALQKHESLFRKYFGKLVGMNHNKFAALNMAFWSGGTFIYVPAKVKLQQPLQSYFRINARGSGQFERTLIIIEQDASVQYVEGCTAPIYSIDNLHAAVVEVFVNKNAECKYSTIQNWSNNVLNLVTKSAIVETNGMMSWIDGNLGSKINMKYPSTILKGDYAKSSTLSIALAMGKNVIQDAGAKMIHLGNYTQSTILSKSIAGKGGIVNYRGVVNHKPWIKGAKSKVECDTMILDKNSKSDTIPQNIAANNTSSIEHEAVVSKMSEQEIYYLESKGLSRDEAREMIVMGFIEPFAKEIPLEYAAELNEIIKIEMEGEIG